MPENEPVCVYCQRASEVVPLIQFIFDGEQHWICPEHLPVMIHHPMRLAPFLPGIGDAQREDAEDAE